MTEQKIYANAALCRDCQACTLACSLYHEGQCNLSLARLAVLKDMARYEFRILVCQRCDTAECMMVCPTEALRYNDEGILVLNEEDCIQCGACCEACPYHALFYDKATDRYLKCDFCAGRPGGPVCVEICPVRALSLTPYAVMVEA